MIGVGLIGYGYWGPKVLRALAATAGGRVTMVSDLRSERLRAAQADHPGVAVTRDARELFRDARVDAVVIATPATSHSALAQAALGAGKDVWVEKPLATTLADAQRLVDRVERSRRVLMVDHTFIYSGAVHALRGILASAGCLPLAYTSVRTNAGVARDDVNVIWDLAVHDLSILDLVMPAAPRAIAARALPRRSGCVEHAADVHVWFAEPLRAHLSVDWLGPAKTRRTEVRSEQRTIVYDDCDAHQKVRVFEHTSTAALPSSDAAISADRTEPLRAAADHFLRCVEVGRRPRTDVHAGLRMVSWLDAATRSLRAGGRPVDLPSNGAAGPAT